MDRIGIVGAGAWGSALAVALTGAGRDVTLWAREPKVAEAIAQGLGNPDFLPGLAMTGIKTTSRLADMAAMESLLLVVPAQFLRAVARDLAPHLPAAMPLVICAKGIEEQSFCTMSEVIAQELPGRPQAVLSGPTFAAEVAAGKPTAVTLAAGDEALGWRLVHAVGTASLRPYYSDDLIGAEMGGAVKNVLAIACGIVEGRKLGDNARAALITRGLAELTRLAVAKGGRAETCVGLSGLGDLILTASSRQSRNYSLGLALAEGRTLAEIQGERRSVAEGVASARSVTGLAASLGVDMPIAAAVAAMLYDGLDLDDAIEGLLGRPFVSEAGPR